MPRTNSDSGFARAILNNWELAGILTLQSGLPFSIIDNPNNNIAVPATFGRITQTSTGPRVVQLAFKLNF